MEQNLTLSAKLKMLSNAYSRVLTAHMQSYELTSSQAHIIAFLMRNGGVAVRQHDIEEHLGFKHPTIIGLLRRMEAKGLVTLSAGEDRRCKTISLTGKGVGLYEEAQRLIEQTDRELFGSLPENKLAELSEILDTVIENARQSDLLSCKGGDKKC